MMKRIGFFIAVSFVVLSLDWWTKALAIESLKDSFPRYYLGGFFRLMYAENTGAWGSMGSDWSPTLRLLFLIVLPMAVLIGMMIFAIIHDKVSKLDLWSYALIVSGGLGNLIDRMRFGHVVDMFWMGFDFPYAHTNVFNIADVAIMIGFGFLLLGQYKEWRAKKSDSTPTVSIV